MTDCIFCKIVAKEIPADFVYENDDTLAFADIHPNNLGHTLVVPKEHFPNIYSTPENILGSMMSAAKKVANGIKSGLQADGVNVHINNDPAAGQLVFHFHMHIIPRYINDGFQMWKGTDRLPEEIRTAAEKIKTAIESSE